MLKGSHPDLLVLWAYPPVLLVAALQAREVEVEEGWDVEAAVNMAVVQVPAYLSKIVQERRGIAAERGHIAVVPPSGPVSGTEPAHHHSLGVP